MFAKRLFCDILSLVDNIQKNQKSKGFLLLVSLGLVAAAAMWGTSFTIVKTALDTVPPFYVLAIRFSIASVLIAVFFIKRLVRVRLKTVLVASFIGLFLFGGNLLQTIGLRYTSAGNSAFITTFYVVLVPLFMWLLYKQRPDRYNIAAALIALAGIGFICLSGGLSIGIGDLLTILAGIFFAVHIALISHFANEHDPLMLTLFQMVINAIISFSLGLIFDGPLPTSTLTPSIMLQLSYLGVFCSFLAFVMQNVGLKYLEAASVSLLVSFESVFGVAVSMIILRERPTAQTYIGFALVFIAVIISQTKLSFLKRREKNDVAE